MSAMYKSLNSNITATIVIPALNEEKTIALAIQSVVKICQVARIEYEILVFDDGSKDKTGVIADQIAKKNKHVKITHFRENQGLGIIFKESIVKASKNYLMFYPGDADMASWFLLELINRANSYGLIISYPRKVQAKMWARRVLSKIFTNSMNIFLGLHLRYYTGPFICRVSLLKKLSLRSQGYAAFFEFKVRLIKQGVSYTEIPFDHVGRSHGVTKIFYPKNITDIIIVACMLKLLPRHNTL